jgi:hypothetical protein
MLYAAAKRTRTHLEEDAKTGSYVITRAGKTLIEGDFFVVDEFLKTLPVPLGR